MECKREKRTNFVGTVLVTFFETWVVIEIKINNQIQISNKIKSTNKESELIFEIPERSQESVHFRHFLTFSASHFLHVDLPVSKIQSTSTRRMMNPFLFTYFYSKCLQTRTNMEKIFTKRQAKEDARKESIDRKIETTKKRKKRRSLLLSVRRLLSILR